MARHAPTAFWLAFLATACTALTNGNESTKNICLNPNNRQDRTLTFVREQVIADSFIKLNKFDAPAGRKGKIPNRFEASDVVIRSDGLVMYVVFDNTFQIGAFCTSLAASSTGCTDTLLDWPDDSVRKLKSDFEGMAYNSLNGTYFVVQETIPSPSKPKKFQPNVFQIRIETFAEPSTVQILESCLVNWQFDSDSKGFEGLEFVVHQRTGKSYLLGLCEANGCASKLYNDRESNNLGNGRLIVLEKREASKKNPCSWEPVGTINLPSTVQFLDYSAVSIYRQNTPNYIAVTSQEDSQVWIGTIEEIPVSPFFVVATLKTTDTIIYDTPRITDDQKRCQVQYCTIEGVAWQNRTQLILVSDQAKKDQDTLCTSKEQSIHYFSMPKNWAD